jgi:hypothetical protein
MPARSSFKSVYCTGYVVFSKNILVFLSDGRTAESVYGDVQSVEPHVVKVFGETFPVFNTAQIEALHPEMIYHPIDSQPLASEPASSLPLNQPDITILPSHDYRDNLHNIKSGGFNQGVGQSAQSR